MRIPLSWLQTLTDIPADLGGLTSLCDIAGLEVATIDEVGAHWEGIVVGEVLSAQPVEGTHLTSVTLGLGSHGERHSMCGASNMGPDKVGAKVAVAMVGSSFETRDKNGKKGRITVVAREVQGQPSEAVLCSEQELGLSDNHDGIYLLEDSATAGTPLAELYGETVIEFELTPDLGRCFSVFGTAREIAALLGQEVNKSGMETLDSGEPGKGSVPVAITSPELCHRYLGAVVHGVKVGPSPDWMQRRLLNSGLRPVNNIVDISNYVLLEMGQPLHFFDRDKLQGGIQVRLSKNGETMDALNGNTYTLNDKALVIADDSGAVAVAGIIGGQDSSVTEETTSVLLEAAHFDNHSVRRTAAAIKLRTDAAERFIKDLDPEWTKVAFERALKLLMDLCPEATLEGYQDAYPHPPAPAILPLSLGDVSRLLGVEFDGATIKDTLGRFDFKVRDEGDGFLVEAPTYRKDVTCQADLVEEVARAFGLNHIPPSTTGTSYLNQSAFGEDLIEMEEILSEVFCGMGFMEAINYSMSGDTWNEFGSQFDAPSQESVRLLNAQSVHREAMRKTLVPALLDNVAGNLRFHDGVHLYELGRSYFRTESGVQELDMIAWVSAGTRRLPFWGEESMGASIGLAFTLYDLKGVVTAALARLGIHGLRFGEFNAPGLTSGQAFSVYHGDSWIGFIGEVDPDWAAKFDISDQKVLAGELCLAPLLKTRNSSEVRFQPLPTQPGMHRDLSILVEKDIPVGKVLATAQTAAGELLEDLTLFDRYTGKGVDDGFHSLAMTFQFRHHERTLRAEEVDAAMAAVIEAVGSQHGASLRG